VGYDAPLTREKPEWFHGRGDIKNWEDPEEVVMGDVHGLPDLAQENPEVYRYLVDASIGWMDKLSLSGFRLDAVKHISNDFWKRYSADLRERAGRDFRVLGELYHGDPSKVIQGFKEGGFDALFDFPLYFAMVDFFCGDKEAGRLASILSLDRLYSDPRRLVTFADNHDLPRVMTACKDDPGRVQALLTFMLSARGVPCITYGTEAGLKGAGEPDNRRDMDFSAADEPLARTIRKLLQVRAQSPALLRGRSMPLSRQPHRLSYMRVSPDEAVFVGINLEDRPWQTSVELAGIGVASDLVSGEELNPAALQVPAMSTRLVRLVSDKRGGFIELTSRLADHPSRTLKVLVDAASTSGLAELRLVGSGPELGSWNPQRGVVGKLRADGSWLFEVELPVRTTASFKLVSVRDGVPTWEQGENRYVDVNEEGENSVSLSWKGGAS
jgi:hypothetical protein